MKQISVVIADDEKIVREGLTKYVDWKAYDMHVTATAENGKRALEIIETQNIDLLITDIHMPVIDGITLLKKLEDQENAPLVILISGFSDFSYAQTALRSSIVQDYILKPLDFDRIDIILSKIRDKINKEHTSVQFPLLNEEEWRLYTSTHASAILNSQKDILERLETGDADKASARFEEAIAVCKTRQLSYNFISRYCIELSLNICERAMDNVNSIALLRNDPVGEISSLGSEEKIFEYVRTLIIKADQVMKKRTNDNLSPLVQKVLNGINSDYSNWALSLNSLADENSVSASYLSNKFKEEVGINFIKYLNSLRIKKAKEMLHDITLKVFMVSEKVGYEDVRYFSRIFRKYTGYTPTEYQKKVTQFATTE